MNSFIELLQISLGVRDSFSRVPQDAQEWVDLQETCGKHNLLAFTFPVIDRLHDETDIPLRVYTRWAMVTEKVREKNKNVLEACKRMYCKFAESGFRSCVLKGQSAARRYPDPSLRQSGDIDIWVEGGHARVVPFLRGRFPLNHVEYHHCGVRMVKGIQVEVHFMPTWMNGFRADKRLQAYFADNAETQFTNYDPSLGFAVTTSSFDAVFLLVHIFRHVLDEGIGLRQLLDYHYLLGELTPAERASALDQLKSLKLDGFAAGIMYVLQQVFATGLQNMLCPPDPVHGRFLLDEIMASGNFGKFDIRNTHAKDEKRIAHGRRKITRAMRYLKYYPGEVLGIPTFLVWHYLWRKKNGYLKKRT